MVKAKENTGGCFFILVGFFLTIGLFLFLSFIFSIPEGLSIIIALLGAGYLTLKWLGIPSLKSILQITAFLIFGILLLKQAVSFLGPLTFDTDHNFTKEEGVNKTIKLIDNDSTLVYESNRTWQDNYGSSYTANLTVRDSDFNTLYNHINTYPYIETPNFWGKLYQYIDNKDSPYLDLVVAEFDRINKEQNLNQMEFADMVVTCIQDIPYSLVFQDACLPAENYEDSIKQVLIDCPDCCIGNIAYGIQNPVSFIQNLKGDCDTRTVLIYSILKQFNYDVAILNSDFYRHSIIGINLPTNGDHKIYKGKKYKVWETTSKYYKAGQLPYGFDNLTHWNVILTSK
ncbi:putative lipoprotein [unidentified eubacterium SCB49]|nr:putative lipoprotein [unidentified eubacterium SCB49]